MKPKSTLSPGAYVAAALDLIQEIGVDKLSMRNVASRLQVSPMAMYKHFPAKEELLAAAFEEFIARADVIPADDLPWEQWIEQVARAMYGALSRELSWVPLLGALPFGGQAAAVTEAFVSKLYGAGFSVEQSLRAYFAMIQLVVGAVCLHSSLQSGHAERRQPGDELAPAMRAYLEKVDSERLPDITVLESVVKLDQIEIGLPLLIDALQAQRLEAVT